MVTQIAAAKYPELDYRSFRNKTSARNLKTHLSSSTNSSEESEAPNEVKGKTSGYQSHENENFQTLSPPRDCSIYSFDDDMDINRNTPNNESLIGGSLSEDISTDDEVEEIRRKETLFNQNTRNHPGIKALPNNEFQSFEDIIKGIASAEFGFERGFHPLTTIPATRRFSNEFFFTKDTLSFRTKNALPKNCAFDDAYSNCYTRTTSAKTRYYRRRC